MTARIMLTDDGRPYRCRVCGQPILLSPEGGVAEPMYGLGYKEEDATAEHWRCHTPTEKIFDDLRDTARKLQEKAKELDRRFRR